MISSPTLRGAAAYRESQQLGGAGDTAPDLVSFGQFLRNEARSAVHDMRQGESATIAGIRGQASVQDVVEAVAQAELSLQKITVVRDRVLSAYQEIMRMPI